MLSPGGAQWAYILAFALIVIIVLIVISLIGAITRQLVRVTMLGWLDSLGGIVLGLFTGALLVAAILTSIAPWAAHQTYIPGLGKAIGDSSLARLLIHNFGLLLDLLPKRFDYITNFFK